MGTRGSGVQVILGWLHNEFEANLGCTRPCLKKHTKPTKLTGSPFQQVLESRLKTFRNVFVMSRIRVQECLPQAGILCTEQMGGFP